MPSEVARLVLGYLREQNCEKAASDFLNESRHLYEYRLGLEEGYEYPTTIGGKNLVQFLHENGQNSASVGQTITTLQPSNETLQQQQQSLQVQEQQKLILEQAKKLEESETQLGKMNGNIEELKQQILLLTSKSSSHQVSPLTTHQVASSSKTNTNTTPENDLFKTPVKQIRTRGYLHNNSHNSGQSGNATTSSSSPIAQGNQSRLRSTPRKTPTPRKYPQSRHAIDPSTSSTPATESGDSTLTPRKQLAAEAAVHVEPQLIFEHLMSDPTAQETFADAANRVLNCLNLNSYVNTLATGPMPDLKDGCLNGGSKSHEQLVSVNTEEKSGEIPLEPQATKQPSTCTKEVESTSQNLYHMSNAVTPIDSNQQQTQLDANDIIIQVLDEIMENDQRFNNLVTGISSKVVDQYEHGDHMSTGGGPLAYPPINFSFGDALESSPFADSPIPGTPSSSVGHVSESDEAKSIISSTGSLETPKSVYNTPKFRDSSVKYSPKGKFSSLAVKNLFDELKTPEKKSKSGQSTATATASSAGVEVVSAIVTTCNTANATTLTKAIASTITSTSGGFINVTPALQQQQQQQATTAVNQAAIQVMTAPTSVDSCINPIVLTLNPSPIVSNFLQLGSAAILPPVTPMTHTVSNVATLATGSQFVRIAPKTCDSGTGAASDQVKGQSSWKGPLARNAKSPTRGKRMSFESFKVAVKKAKLSTNSSLSKSNELNGSSNSISSTTVSTTTKTPASTTTASTSSLSSGNAVEVAVASSVKSSSHVTKITTVTSNLSKTSHRQANNEITGRPSKTIIVSAPSSKFKHFKDIFMEKLSDDKKIDDFLKSKVHRVSNNNKPANEPSGDIDTK